MGKSRTEYAVKNFTTNTLSSVVNLALNFISRTVFVYMLGELYLGVSGLFTNVLGLLSLAELGIGSAIGFSLYKPLAEKDTAKIQAIIQFYKQTYRYVAAIVAVVGLVLMPFLPYIVKEAADISNLYLIFGIYLINTVSSYLITYKTTILTADQKEYRLVNINMIIKAATIGAQILVLIIFRDFVAYLLVEFFVQLIGKLYLNYYVNRQYPYLSKKAEKTLDKAERKVIFDKVKALALHKVGEVSINQTDNIITSAFVSVTMVGLVSNFVLVSKAADTFVRAFFNSATAGFGNLIATESKEKQYQMSKVYDYLGFVFYGWSAIVLYFCLTPFVKLWMGESRLVDGVTIALLCANYYLTGARVPLANVKAAAGVFEQDKWVPLVQSVTNIVVSIIGARLWGLKGIYIGTLVSSMWPNIVRPMVIYKHIFDRKCASYFRVYFWRIAVLLADAIVIALFLNWLAIKNDFLNLLVSLAVSAVVAGATIILMSLKTEEFSHVQAMAQTLVKKVLGRGRDKYAE